MRTHPIALLPALLLALLSTVRAQDPPPEVEDDPKVVEPKIDRILEEYEAIRASQDLVPTRRRRELARRLGYLKHHKSTRLLLRIVEDDPDIRARIEAMNSLARVGDFDAIRHLYKVVLKEAKRTVLDDFFTLAMGHATAPEVGPWLVDKVLKTSLDNLQLGAVEALGELRTQEARPDLLLLLEREDKRTNRDMHLYYELLRALGRIGGDEVRPVLQKAALDTDWRVRLAVAEVLLEAFADDESVELQRKLLQDEKAIVRETAAITAGNEHVEKLFPELILLMREGNLRGKHAAYEALCKISGQDYGYAPDAWDKWWRDKQAGRLTEQGDIASRETMSVATYYNFKVFSDRVLFVIDVSGSMQWPDFHPNRIEVAARELTKVIEMLDEKTLFNVSTFAGHVNPWQRKGEVPATDANKADALEWVEKNLLPRGATNTYGALMSALEDNPEVDTVYFLSDGIPSTGKFEVPEEILMELRRANRFRKVVFNTIALAIGKASIEKAQKYEDPEEMAAFMKDIADITGGVSVDIRKPYLDR